jgi:hypothetical protein
MEVNLAEGTVTYWITRGDFRELDEGEVIPEYEVTLTKKSVPSTEYYVAELSEKPC